MKNIDGFLKEVGCHAKRVRSDHANWREQTSEAESGSKSAVHVFVVDEDGNPVTGQRVSAHFSYGRFHDTVSYQFTDAKGHAEFLREHHADPRLVEIFVRGESFGPYALENGANYTVEISRE